eukprot:2367476-Pleurochrysis_carterae.AAC.1
MSELTLMSVQACTVSVGREMRSAGGLTLDISGSSGGWSENLDLAPTQRLRGRPSSSPSRSRGPSASLWVGELDLLWGVNGSSRG